MYLCSIYGCMHTSRIWLLLCVCMSMHSPSNTMQTYMHEKQYHAGVSGHRHMWGPFVGVHMHFVGGVKDAHGGREHPQPHQAPQITLFARMQHDWGGPWDT